MRKRDTFPNQNRGAIEDAYILGEELGSGAFSVVRRGIHIKSKTMFAIKIVDKTQMNFDEMYEELRVMSKLDHPNIVKFKEVFESHGHYYVVLEMITGGELFDRIIELRRYTEKDASYVMRQALNALKHMHDVNIVHRDLKPENLLLSSKNADATVKLADFGFATDCLGDFPLEEMLGTPPYFAPELAKLRHSVGKYGKPVDVWAMGVIMYILLSGFHPFQIEDEDQMLNNIENSKWNWLGPNWDKVTDEAKDLIKKMMDADPKKRFTVNQCLSHVWLAGNVASDAELQDIAVKLAQFQAKKKLRSAILGVIASNKLKRLMQATPRTRSYKNKTKIALKIMSGHDLAAKDRNGKSDPYLKIFYGTERYKTSIQRKTLNPVWTDQDHYVLRYQTEVPSLRVECWDWDRVGSDDFMGQFDVDMTGLELDDEVVKAYPLQTAGKDEVRKTPSKKTENVCGSITISLMKFREEEDS